MVKELGVQRRGTINKQLVGISDNLHFTVPHLNDSLFVASNLGYAFRRERPSIVGVFLDFAVAKPEGDKGRRNGGRKPGVEDVDS